MQPSREREGKSVGEGEGNTVGMQPSAKAEGKSVVEGEADWPRLRREGRDRWVGALVFPTAWSQPFGLLPR
ncbi:MAG: hypothetical protein KatS3mg005_1434 [Bryobacteraceae bacterium]|nr:MAG: hypothetical protein KatS3mg005_1434 [Bryobacteraceae bacterium]